MRICVLAPHDLSYDGGPNVVVRNLIGEWSRFHFVTLVTVSNSSFNPRRVERVTIGGGRYSTWLIQSFRNLGRILNHDVILDESLTFPVLQIASMKGNTEPVLHFHGGPKINGLGDRSRRSELKSYSERLISMAAAKSIIASSQIHREAITKSFGGFLDHKIRVIGHGVDLNLFRRSKVAGRQIMFVGNIGEGDLFFRKGVAILLNALSIIKREIPDVRLVVVGTVDSALERTCVEFGVSSHVEWLGHLRQNEVARLYSESRVLVLPSIFDAYGQVVNEAMASGVPVIVSDGVGASEVVRSANCGLIFPRGNVQRLRDCLSLLLESKDLAIELGENGRSYAFKYLSWELVAQKYVEAFAADAN